MADGNGATSSPTEFGTFLIGGEKVRVPVATLYLAEARQEDFDSLGPEQSQREYIRTCCRLLAFMIDEEGWEKIALDLWKKIRFNERDQFMTSMRDWMILSGLVDPGEAVATVENQGENLGTGTSAPSSQNLPFTEFVEATSTGSSEATH